MGTSLFDERTPIIYQDPTPTEFVNSRKFQKWILLPQIAYKVLVPYPKDRVMNVFQETVLKLFRSGRKTPEYIADRLLLHLDLAEHIIGELLVKGFLSEAYTVTPAGEEALLEQVEPHEMKTGYVFYDVLSGTYWDTFLFDEQLQTVDAPHGHKSNEYRTFTYGNVGNPKKEKALALRSGLEAEPEAPGSIDILKICYRHDRRMRQLRRGGNGRGIKEVQLPPNTEKVKFLGESRPYYVATMLFFPIIAGGDASYWHVCHPFMGGLSQNLRQSLERIKEEPERRALKEEIRSLTELAYGVTDTERELRRSESEKQAAAYLTGILGDGIRGQHTLYRQLVELHNLSASLSSMSGNLGKHYDTVQSKMSSYIDAAYRLMAEVLYVLKQQYQDYFRSDYLQGDVHRNSEILGVIANRIGFKDSSDVKVFPRTLNVKKGAVDYSDEAMDVKSLLAANLLMASEVTDHPFWRLAKRVPQFIVFLDDLKNKRNVISHSVDETFLFKAVEILLPRLLYLLSILFDGLHFQYDRDNRPQITFGEDEADSFTADIDQKLYLLSESTVDDVLGPIGREYPTIRKALIDLHYIRKTRTGNFLVGCSKVLEEACNVWGRQALDPGEAASVGPDMERNLKVLQERLAALGLKFDPDQLPRSFRSVKPAKIKATFRNFEKGVLSTKVYALLYSSLRSGSPVLEDIGRTEADFITVCAAVSDRRKHGGDSMPPAQEADMLLRSVQELTKSLLPIFQNHSITCQ
jgi:hypothetical protein